MNKHEILQIASKSPQFAQAVQALDQQMQANPITSEQLAKLIKTMHFALSHPQAYPQIIEAAIKDGYTKPGDMPEQFDQVLIVSILAALYIVQAQMEARGKGHSKPHKMARGGLAQAARRLQAQGRNGDTILAHISPQEARMLQQSGGSGSINPHTGLPEFFSLRSFLGAIIPIVVNYFVPGAGAAIGGAMGMTGTAAAMAGSAVIGAGSAAVAGNNIGQGALMGGLTGGLGDMAGSAVNSGMELGLGETGQQLLGAGMMGAAGGAATGQGLMQGAMQGVAGKWLGNQVQGVAGDGGLGKMVNAAGNTFGNAMTAGHDVTTAATMGGLAGLSQGLSGKGVEVAKPADSVLDSLRAYEAGQTGDIAPTEPHLSADEYANTVAQGLPPGAAPTTAATPAAATPAAPSGLTMDKVLVGAGLLGSLTSAPPEVQQAVSTLSPEQQKYFQQPLVKWDWDKLKQDAAASNLSLNQYIARNWTSVYSGAYNQKPAAGTPKLARGGPLSRIAYLARGSGSGRADTIDAKLSDGEYVIDAETVALLGDGSNQAGAKRLDEMRASIRAQKGKMLAKGKISPNARSPLTYIQGVA